ncbi:hypothetical protein [Micromonospora musae]|uniref:hypothetical protein n=1 Tax=Micromonospora musae TaxID=1894970 RepID=UPI00341C7EB2
MDGVFGQLGLAQNVQQQVWVRNGFGYGVIGADLHVFGDGRPVYLLTEAGRRPDLTLTMDEHGLPAQPSHLLNARHAVVDFTGRDREVDDLTAWRDDGNDRAVRWLHAPGGQGKTRLGSRVAELAVREGWKVISAEHSQTQVVPAGEQTSHDMRIGNARGLLMLVDYADRWPLAHLTWLFSNKVLDQNVPVRVLLLARNAHVWPAMRHALTQGGWPPDACTTQALGALPPVRDARRGMFVAARDCFARHYGMPDTTGIGVPDWLERDEFGLTLAVHMAALVAVDRHARRAPEPAAPRDGVTALTAYLLQRESQHWAALHGPVDPRAGARTVFHTDPRQMRRAVFTAALTGPLGYRDARATLDKVGVGSDVDQVLSDHTFCYPPTDPRTALEPLYPDRLAEDFLALCLPGHDTPDHESDSWAHGTPEVLLTPPGGDGPLPPYAARAITFLTAASDRWPHLIATLEGLERLLPQDPHDAAGELTVAAADLTDRLARHRLPTLTDPAARAALHDLRGRWLNEAHREQEAAAALTEATQLYRPLAATDPRTFEPKLAESAFNLAMVLALGGIVPQPDELPAVYFLAGGEAIRPGLARPDEALAAYREAIGIYRRLAHDDPAEHEEKLAAALFVAALCGPHMGAAEESLALARECVDLVTRLAREQETDGDDNSVTVALTLAVLAGNLVTSEPDEAVVLAHQAVDILRRLADDNPTEPEHEEVLHSTLALQAAMLLRLRRTEPAIAVIDEAVRIGRRIQQRENSDGDAWQDTLAVVLGLMWMQGAGEDVAAGLETALLVVRHEAQINPTAHGTGLANTFHVLDLLLRRLERWDLVLAGQRDLIDLLKRSDDSLRYDLITGVLGANGTVLVMLRRWDDVLDVIGEMADELQREGAAAGREYALSGALSAVATNGSGVVHDGGGYEELAQDEIIATLSRIAAAYRQRSDGDEQERDHGFAVTLKLLAEGLWIMNRSWESLAASGEAVEVRRRLARDGSSEHRQCLAFAMQYHARKAGRLGQHEEAAAAAKESAHLYERLAREDFAEHGRTLAATLHILAVNLWWIQPAHALEPAQRAVEILRRWASSEPAADQTNLAQALDTLASLLHQLGRGEEARAAESQAAEIQGRLAARGTAPT